MITVKHLSKTFTDKAKPFTVLRDVNCEINQGEVISIIGPSGTGKSTFLRCINGLEKATSGEILIDGVDILDKKTDIDKIRLKMGMVFQNFNLFNNLSVLDNLTVGPRHLLGMSKKEAIDQGMKLLHQVGLAEKAHNMPSELSGGQKQRVAIARCLSLQPEIILFDEPTSALDPTMVGEVLSVIRQLAEQGMTMLIVTHEMDFARDVSSRIFFMNEGIIYEDDTPDVIFNKPNKPATTAFVNKLCGINQSVNGRDYDRLGMESALDEFCKKYAIPNDDVSTAKTVIAEMIEHVLPMDHSVDVHLDYSKKKQRIYVAFYQPNSDIPILEGDTMEAYKKYVEPHCVTMHDDPEGDNRRLRLKIRHKEED